MQMNEQNPLFDSAGCNLTFISSKVQLNLFPPLSLKRTAERTKTKVADCPVKWHTDKKQII